MYVGMKTSWPLALQGGFEPNLTGYDNVRFISEIYRVPFRETLDQVTDFAELGRDIYMPLQYYSNGMRARLAFALSLTIDFECLLIDEVLAVGDRRFQRKCEYEMFERRKHHTMIVAIHAPDFVAQNCSRAMVIKNGRARIFDDVKLAAEIYSTL
jgi:capsular polysaccharide transport system ATP-binding protein